MPNVLLTGFDPFGGDLLNPSWLAVKSLQGRQIAGHRVVAAQLPTVFDSSIAALKSLLQQHRPALVICVGQAGGRNAISLERVAININDARIADNVGAQPIDTAVLPDAPAAYFTSMPIKAMRQALMANGITAEVSQTAGTFVCNHVFFGLMHMLATQRELKRSKGGFIHVPWLPEQGTPAMPLEDIIRGIKLAVRVALTTTTDAVLGAGSLS